MDGIYYVIREIATGAHCGPPGVSQAPHLYLTKGKAEGQRKRFGPLWADKYETVPVQLTEIKGE